MVLNPSGSGVSKTYPVCVVPNCAPFRQSFQVLGAFDLSEHLPMTSPVRILILAFVPPGLTRNPSRTVSSVLREGVRVYYYRTYYKAVRGGGGGEWTTCAMIDDEPRPVWMSPLITH